jgi:hypothetical protein
MSLPATYGVTPLPGGPDARDLPTPAHEHVWQFGHVATEADRRNPMYHQVVYLFCQCGATKRSVPE